MPTAPTTFHLFPNLPAKLGVHIWELTAEPRIVETFSGITTKPWDGFDPVPEGYLERKHYGWFNFDSDMLSIGDTDLHKFLAAAHQVRRLRLRRNLDDEYFLAPSHF
ncbi:hypothetical protein CCHR01_07050 [Colletotrichum chrysophilum]|uniref:2EXR domain-containing protein n=1 Tax=Colletotrichum chrysophilum TaxID=1836956 RepID=A0AAD9AL99_9PEZI|nr:hypothetical protein CCHR01_07050 [Colletotrichum chrysophilum]